uniref:Uncharacterized protein n=1 Tax=Physcomitrium patens TaxID=3218 RepID=A0A2K1JVE7_PHYPA|nr:hypothetical protein PHYPA_015272 [Physcomitrium patens]
MSSWKETNRNGRKVLRTLTEDITPTSCSQFPSSPPPPRRPATTPSVDQLPPPPRAWFPAHGSQASMRPDASNCITPPSESANQRFELEPDGAQNPKSGFSLKLLLAVHALLPQQASTMDRSPGSFCSRQRCRHLA